MEVKQILCVASHCINAPEMIGLPGESLTSQEWMKVFSSGYDLRSYLRNSAYRGEVWVLSSDDVSPINIASALKADNNKLHVALVSKDNQNGSLVSRVQASGIDELIFEDEFPLRYLSKKSSQEFSLGLKYVPQTEGTYDIHQELQVGNQGSVDGEKDNIPLYSLQYNKSFSCTPFERSNSIEGIREASSDDGLVLALRDEKQRTQDRAQILSSALIKVDSSEVKKDAVVIPVVSGSGGSGKSTISVLMALLLQRRGYKTLLMDFDLQFGDTEMLLGLKDVLRSDEAIYLPQKMDKLKCEGAMPAVLASPRRLEDSEVVREGVPQLLDYLSGNFEVIVVNTGAAWDEHHAALLERSPKALFLVDQRPSSLRATKHALQLCSRLGIALNSFVFAANRCTKKALFSSMDVSCALGGRLCFELADGTLEVEELLGAGLPFELLDSHNALCLSIEHLLDEAFSLEPKNGNEEKGKSRRRKGKFSLLSSKKESD